MAEIINIEKLNEGIRKTVQDYCAEFTTIHLGNLKSIYVYGSAASNEFIPCKSNVNLLAIFENIDPPDLKKTLKLVIKGRKKGIIAPLMLTMEHIKRSSDAFPIEFLEIKENCILLFGQDIMKDLDIGTANIRLQCEQQIKGALIRLYQSYLEIGANRSHLRVLLEDSLKTLMPSFRSLLRIKGRPVPVGKKDIIEGVSREFNLNSRVFMSLLDMREGKTPFSGIQSIFDCYIEEIEKLGMETDRLKP